MDDLAYMGISAASMFPGLDGACKALREKYFRPRPVLPQGRPVVATAPALGTSSKQQDAKDPDSTQASPAPATPKV